MSGAERTSWGARPLVARGPFTTCHPLGQGPANAPRTQLYRYEMLSTRCGVPSTFDVRLSITLQTIDADLPAEFCWSSTTISLDGFGGWARIAGPIRRTLAKGASRHRKHLPLRKTKREVLLAIAAQ